MFISVKFGADEVVLVNPACSSHNFLIHLHDVLGKHGFFTDVDKLDLCDTEGNVVGILCLKPRDHVSSLVTFRSTYIPIKSALQASDRCLHPDHTDQLPYEPILSRDHPLYGTISAALQKQRHGFGHIASKSPAAGRISKDTPKPSKVMPATRSKSRVKKVRM